MAVTHTNTPPAASGGGAKIIAGVIGSALLFGALFTAGMLPRLKNKERLASEAQEVRSAVPAVQFVTPHFAKAGDLLLPGNVSAIEETTIYARASGYVRKRYADIGSRVKAGQLLAEIESPDLDQQLAQAQADTAKSQATVGQSQADVARLKAGVVQTQADVARQRANVKQARAQQTSTESKLAQAQAAQGTAEAKLAQSKQALEVQKANLAQANAQLDLARATSKRYQDLLKQGFVAQQDAEEKATAVQTSAATVQAVQAAINAGMADVEASQQAVRASEAVVRSAQSDVEASKENVNAVQAALGSTQATVQAAQSSVNASQSNVAATRAAVGSSQANTQRYKVLRSFEKVTAPFDGVITTRNVDTGALITATGDTSGGSSKGLFGIARTDVLRIQINVPQTFVSAIRPGQKASVLIREFPGKAFEGTVFQSSGALDANTRTLLTEVRIANPGNVLRPGMYAQVQFTAPESRALPRIAASTLVINADGPHVVSVSNDNKAHFLPVVIGRDFGTELEVTQGLSGQEHLITNPTDDLKEGDTVQATPAPLPPPPAGAAPGMPPAKK